MKTIDDVQKYWDKSPCNIKRSPAEVGTIEWCLGTEKNKYFVESHIIDFAEFHKWEGKKVLEIGCGIGITACSFARAGAKVVAIDISDESLELAKKRAELFDVVKNIKFYHGDAEILDKFIPIESFDLIWSFGVIHHTPNPEKVIECIKKYMTKKSILKIMVYNKWSWKVFWILMKYGKGVFWNLDKLVAEYSEAQTGCPVTYTYTKRTAKKLLKGLNIIKIQVEHIFPYRISDYISHKYVKVWYFRWLPESFFRWLEKILGWHLCIEAKI